MNQTEMAAHDELTATKLGAYELAKAQAASALEALHRYVGDEGKREWIGRRSYTNYSLNADQVLERANAGDFRPAYNALQGSVLLERYMAKKAEAETLSRELSELDAKFRAAGGWSRFFIVTGGHIHSSMRCSSCNKNGQATSFGWLPAMSGRGEADVVAEHGALLCTVCFPSAPVEWTNQHELDEAAKKNAQCSGSGKSPAKNDRPYARYQPCSECGVHQSVTSRGAIRAHKPSKK